MELGNAWARAARFDEARESYARALALDPADPPLRRNLARLEVQAGDAAAALAWADGLEREGRLPERWYEGAAAEAARGLRPDVARALLARARPEWRDLSTQALWDRAHLEPESSRELAAALEGLAHLEWAREQVASGDPVTAVRSYRQAVRGLADPVRGTAAPTLRLELAAALLRAGRGSEAAAEAAAAGAGPRDLLRLEPWAGEELLRAGLIGR
jgi:tetratricopeptide (TPR) repeat protein